MRRGLAVAAGLASLALVAFAVAAFVSRRRPSVSDGDLHLTRYESRYGYGYTFDLPSGDPRTPWKCDRSEYGLLDRRLWPARAERRSSYALGSSTDDTLWIVATEFDSADAARAALHKRFDEIDATAGVIVRAVELPGAFGRVLERSASPRSARRWLPDEPTEPLVDVVVGLVIHRMVFEATRQLRPRVAPPKLADAPGIAEMTLYRYVDEILPGKLAEPHPPHARAAATAPVATPSGAR